VASISKDNLKALKTDMDDLDAANRHMKKLVNEFEIENADIITRMKLLKEAIAIKRDQVVIEAVDEFKETGKKKLLGGIGIRERTKLQYEADKAMEWALDHELCLKLDIAKFESIAKTDSELDFVQYETEVIVTFPKEIDI